MNQVILVGHVGAEARPIGDAGVSLRIATNEKGKDGIPRTDWHDAVFFGKLTERANQVAKGDSVCVVGKLQTRQVAKADGSTTNYTNVLAYQLIHTPKGPVAAEQATTAPLGF